MPNARVKAALFSERLEGWKTGPLRLFERRVLSWFQSKRLSLENRRLYVACSGGVDSTALLFCLIRLAPFLGYSLGILHVNHAVRKESELEELFTLEIARRLRMPWCGLERLKPLGLEGSEEAALREFRYSFFEHVLKKDPASILALGHHLSDRIETFLMFFLRGSGLRGLSSLRAIRNRRIIRPFIESSRKEIEAYAEQAGLPFFLDSTNEDEAYLRNRLRKRVIPALMEVYPGLESGAKRSFRLIEAESELLDHQARALLGECLIQVTEHKAVLQTDPLIQAPDSLSERTLFLLFESLFGLYPDNEKLYRLLERFKKERSFCLRFDNDLEAFGFCGKLTIKWQEVKEEPKWLYKVLNEGYTACPEAGFDIEVRECRAYGLSDLKKRVIGFKGCKTIYLDSQSVRFPLIIRPARKGDRIKPLGMGSHFKKLKEVFQESRIEPQKRWGWPVLEVGGEIIWVIGVKQAETSKVLPQTQTILEIRAWPAEQGGPVG